MAMFKPLHPVCVVSASTGWGIEEMVAAMMRCLPDRATSPVVTQLHRKLCTEPVKSQARDSFVEAVGRVFDTAESSSFLSASLKTVIRSVRDAVVSVTGPSGTGYSFDIAIFSANDELVVNDLLIVDTSFPLRFIIN